MSRFSRLVQLFLGRDPEGTPPRCDRCDGWHPTDEVCGALHHALDVLDPDRREGPVLVAMECQRCETGLLRRIDDSLCPSCAHRIVARLALGRPFVGEGGSAGPLDRSPQASVDAFLDTLEDPDQVGSAEYRMIHDHLTGLSSESAGMEVARARRALNPNENPTNEEAS